MFLKQQNIQTATKTTANFAVYKIAKKSPDYNVNTSERQTTKVSNEMPPCSSVHSHVQDSIAYQDLPSNPQPLHVRCILCITLTLPCNTTNMIEFIPFEEKNIPCMESRA